MKLLCGCNVLMLAVSLGAPVGRAQEPITLRYHFKAGDHLMYRETLEREGKSPDTTFRTRAVFTNHLVVISDTSGAALVGIQRNRQSAELVEYRQDGRDRVAQEKPQFEERMSKRPAEYFDANVYTTAGLPRLPIPVVREANSDQLYLIAEVAPLPGETVAVGSGWIDATLKLGMRLQGREMIGDESCVVAIDRGDRPNVHFGYTFCPVSGRLAKLTLEGQYNQVGDSVVRERVAFELVEAHQKEPAATWLVDNAVQQAVLAAYLVASNTLPEPALLEKALRSDRPQVQALALAVYYQNRLAPPADVLASLGNSKDPELRRVADRFRAAAAANGSLPCPVPDRPYSRQKPGTTLRSISTGPFAGTPYVIHVPIDYRGDVAFPVIVYLSGGGGRSLDAAQTADQSLGHLGYVAVYPEAGGLWWEQKPTHMVDALLQQVMQEYNVDSNRVYLAGFSNGGTGAMQYAALWPQRFAAVASLMGAGVQTPASEKLALNNLADVPVLLLHGDKDTRIPPAASTQTYDELRGIRPRDPPELHILKGREHDITLDSDEGYSLAFFQRFTREPFPHNVRGTVTDMSYPRRYWIEVMEKGNGAAEVEGRILAQNVMEIKAKNVRRLRLLLRPELLNGGRTFRVRVNGKEQGLHELQPNCELFSQSAQQGDASLAYTDQMVLAVP